MALSSVLIRVGHKRTRNVRTSFVGSLDKGNNESHDPISSSLALLDGQDSVETSHDLLVEIVAIVIVIGPSDFERMSFEPASFLDLAKLA